MFTSLARIGLVLATVTVFLAQSGDVEAGYRYRRQYYTTWSYYPSTQYYYRTFYYYPTPAVTTYSYHYVVYYPSRPQYVYYYNPVSRTYWGRFEFDANGKPKGYSLLAQKDRKEKLSDIPESAFPPAGEMPAVPGTNDKLKMEAPPSDLPRAN